MTRQCPKIIALVLLGVVLAGAARGETVFPARTGRVVDEAGLLSQRVRDALTRQLAEHERMTSNQVVVVTVRSLQGMRIEAYSLALANRWGVGQTGRNNGVVLLVAPNERQVRIEVGIDLERRLSDAIAADIIQQQMLPAFRVGSPEAGIQDGVNGILAALGDRYQMVERPQWSADKDAADQDAGQLAVVVAVIAVLIVLVFVVAVLNALTGGRLLSSLSSAGGNWRSDDEWSHSSRRFGYTSRSERSSTWSDSSGHSFWGGGHSSGGGFRGGGASGRW